MSPVVAANPLRSTEFLLTVGLLAVVLVAGAVVLYATDRWRKRQEDDRPDDSPMTLSHYRDLYEAGELTETEYVKVRDRLTAKMRGQTVPSPAPPGPPDPPAE